MEELGISDFDAGKIERDVMTLLGHFAASQWMNDSLEDQWWLKGYNWLSGEEDPFYNQNSIYVKEMWALFKLHVTHAPKHPYDQNTIDCVQAVMDAYDWDQFQQELRTPGYRWGLVHGDFHAGQLMYQPDSGDLVLLDWESSGIIANPAIDVASWTYGSLGPK